MTAQEPMTASGMPREVRDRDRTGRRCQEAHPTRVVKAEGATYPVRCRLVDGHQPKVVRHMDGDTVTAIGVTPGHWSHDGGVETEW